MKLTRKKIQAASDYRTFVGLSLDEVEESNPDVYYDYIYDIRFDVDTVYLSKSDSNNMVGVQDKEGKYYVYNAEDEPGWYEINFDELFTYLQ